MSRAGRGGGRPGPDSPPPPGPLEWPGPGGPGCPGGRRDHATAAWAGYQTPSKEFFVINI